MHTLSLVLGKMAVCVAQKWADKTVHSALLSFD